MAYFGLSIFLSAFLLFQVEPMIAKIILPWFGGSSGVWSSVVLFFQVLLTGGYAYSHWLLRKSRREVLHLVLLGMSLVLVLVLGSVWKSPIIPSENWRPVGVDMPIWQIFKILFISVGIPFFLLSSNSSLIQAWFNRAYPQKTTYRLYSISNIGSLLGLLTYPVMVEPNLTLVWQGRVWSLAYMFFAASAAYGTFKTLKQRRIQEASVETQLEPARPTAKDYFLWTALAATASIILLAITSKITQEVAVIPFLWVLPLSIYLITFILAFSGERWYSRQIFLLLFFASTLLAGWVQENSFTLGVLEQIGIYTLILFCACMVCHGEIYRIRPHPTHLTSFYLMVSIGGALGGLVINFLAPIIFKGFWEFPLGLVLCWLLWLVVLLLYKKANLPGWISFLEVVLAIIALIITGFNSFQQIQADLINNSFIERNFYGVLRVRQRDFNAVIPIHLEDLTITAYHRYALLHGSIVHGYQFHDETLRNLPTSYYGRTGGAGLAILNHPNRNKGMRVGVLGLGVGTLAAYGRPGDVYRFYEINPAVIQLAKGQNSYFTYLSDSQAKVEIVPGDARLSLEQELGAGEVQNYDVLLLDVFSSDSIPVHLLDAEAFHVYLQQLSPQGILAIHITNRHLDLVPVVWTLAETFDLARVLINNSGNGVITYESKWFLLSRDPVLLANPTIRAHAENMSNFVSGVRLWTDDYNNLFQILK